MNCEFCIRNRKVADTFYNYNVRSNWYIAIKLTETQDFKALGFSASDTQRYCRKFQDKYLFEINSFIYEINHVQDGFNNASTKFLNAMHLGISFPEMVIRSLSPFLFKEQIANNIISAIYLCKISSNSDNTNDEKIWVENEHQFFNPTLVCVQNSINSTLSNSFIHFHYTKWHQEYCFDPQNKEGSQSKISGSTIQANNTQSDRKEGKFVTFEEKN